MQLVKRRRASTTSRYKPASLSLRRGSTETDQQQDPKPFEPPPRLPSPTFPELDPISLPYLSDPPTRRRSRSFSAILDLSLVPYPMQDAPRLHSSRFTKSSTGSGWRSVTPGLRETSVNASTELPQTPRKHLPLPLPPCPASPSYFNDTDSISKPATPTKSLFRWHRTPKKSSPDRGGLVDVWLGGIGKTLAAPGGLLLSPASLSESRKNSSMEALEQWESWAKISQTQDDWSPSQKFESLGCAKARMPLAERERWRERPRVEHPKQEIVWGQAV